MEKQSPEIEKVLPDLELHWYFNRQVVKYVITAVNSKTLDEWSRIVVDLIQDWSPDKPYLALHDLSDRGIGISFAAQVQFDMQNLAIRPKAREQVEALLTKRRNYKTRVALLFNSYHSGYIGQLLARRSRKQNSIVEYEVFYDEQSALKWLSKHLGENNEDKT